MRLKQLVWRTYVHITICEWKSSVIIRFEIFYDFPGAKPFRHLRETGPWCHMWVEFVVGFRPVPRVLSGFSGFPSSTKTNIFKFVFDQEERAPWKPAKTDVVSSLNIPIFYSTQGVEYGESLFNCMQNNWKTNGCFQKSSKVSRLKQRSRWKARNVDWREKRNC